MVSVEPPGARDGILVFVGHFAPPSEALRPGSSIPGNEVQRTLVDQFRLQWGRDRVVACVMNPHPAWPRGPLFVRSKAQDGISFLGYMNLPVLKHIVFAISLFCFLVAKNVAIVCQYNSYLSENIAILIARSIKRFKCAAYIQDVFIVRGSTSIATIIRSMSERLSLRLLGAMDLVVGVSLAIRDDFKIPPSRFVLFQGAPTTIGYRLLPEPTGNLEPIAVFAGALEPYNGIDRLIKRWVTERQPWTLHVFGRGSWESAIRDAASAERNVVFHGLQPPATVIEFQKRASWSFCLRYSTGIDERYFFPSKFFDAGCAPGVLVTNDFFGVPDALRPYLAIVEDDLGDLRSVLERTSSSLEQRTEARRALLQEKFSWQASVAEVLSRLVRSAPSR